MARVLDGESPHLVVFTGDNIHDTNDSERSIREYSEPVITREIPWAAIFGNHDEDAGMKSDVMMEFISSLPFSVSEHGPQDVFGVGNYVIQIIGENGFESFQQPR